MFTGQHHSNSEGKELNKTNYRYLKDEKSIDNGLLSLQLLIGINQQLQFVFQIKLPYPYVRGSCVGRIVDKIKAKY